MNLLNAKSIAAMFTIGAAAAGCSDNTTMQTPDDYNAINFSVTVPNATPRVTTTANINTFCTWAFTDGKPYMTNVTVVKNESGQWVYSPTAFWPADAALNFFSCSPAIQTVDANTAENPDIPNFISYGKTDLLYGVNMGVTRKDGKVNINFRHALSQIRFCLRKQPQSVSGVEIAVKVSEIKLMNVSTAGSFNFPFETTSAESTVTGKWTGQSYTQDISIFTPPAADLGDEPAEFCNTGYVFAIPQTLPVATATATAYSGSYVRVLCKITDPGTGVTIWPAKDSPNYVDEQTGGYIIFPLSTEEDTQWEPGKAYVYNMTVGVPSSTDRIDFDVTVDEYGDFANLPLEN